MRKAVYLNLLNELKTEAKAIGVRVFIYKRAYDKRLRTSGRFDGENSRIMIFTFGKQEHLNMPST
jgi:hypothetical protein